MALEADGEMLISFDAFMSLLIRQCINKVSLVLKIFREHIFSKSFQFPETMLLAEVAKL